MKQTLLISDFHTILCTSKLCNILVLELEFWERRTNAKLHTQICVDSFISFTLCIVLEYWFWTRGATVVLTQFSGAIVLLLSSKFEPCDNVIDTNMKTSIHDVSSLSVNNSSIKWCMHNEWIHFKQLHCLFCHQQ